MNEEVDSIRRDRRDESRERFVASVADGQDPRLEALPPGLLRRGLATLDPGYFDLVMATGIISIGANLLGYPALSRVTLGVTIAAFVILVVAYAPRLVWSRGPASRRLHANSAAVAGTCGAGRGYAIAPCAARCGFGGRGQSLQVPALGNW